MDNKTIKRLMSQEVLERFYIAADLGMPLAAQQAQAVENRNYSLPLGGFEVSQESILSPDGTQEQPGGAS